MRAHLHEHDIRAWARSYLRALDEGGALVGRCPAPTPAPTASLGCRARHRPDRQPGRPQAGG